MSHDRFQEFSDIGFDDVRRMAQDDTLIQCEQMGLPDEYRTLVYIPREYEFLCVGSKRTSVAHRSM